MSNIQIDFQLENLDTTYRELSLGWYVDQIQAGGDAENDVLSVSKTTVTHDPDCGCNEINVTNYNYPLNQDLDLIFTNIDRHYVIWNNITVGHKSQPTDFWWSSEEFILKARKYRKMLGGGMRQAGIIAAPGIIAITKMVDRLADDHANAKLLAEGLSEINGIEILNPVKTNMVYIDVSGLGWTGKEWREACEKLGWKCRGTSPAVRLVTHYGIEREDIEAFLEGIVKLIPK